MRVCRKNDSTRWLFQRVVTISFLVAIWVPFVGTFLNIDPSSPTDEHRVLAAFPTSFSRDGFHNYFTDHLGFRDSLIRLHGKTKLKCFGSTNEKIVIGKSGWLFCNFNDAIAGSTGRFMLNDIRVKRWETVLCQRADYLNHQGIHYGFLVVPDKHYVHREFLPDSLADAKGPTCLAQFLQKTQLPGVNLIDIQPELFNAKKENELFFQGDTHWNGYGKAAGYQGMLRNLRNILGPQPYLHPKPFQVAIRDPKKTRYSANDLYRQMAVEQHFQYPISYCRVPKPKAKRIETPPAYLDLEKDYRTKKHFVAVFENPQCQGPRLVMFHTSFFAGELRNLLAEHFSRIVFVRHSSNHYLGFHKFIVDQEQPSIVINEIPARYLTTDPLIAYRTEEWDDAPASLAARHPKGHAEGKR